MKWKGNLKEVNMSDVIVIAGPTAVGKTEYAIELAKEINGEIVSCDSMQIYKYLDIGSAKPTSEEREKAVHHLIDFVNPKDSFSVADYAVLARKIIDDILKRGRRVIVVGGTGLYLNSLIYDMDFSGTYKNDELRKKYELIANEKGKNYLYQILKEKDEAMANKIHFNNVRKIIRALEIIDLGGSNLKEFSRVEEKKSSYSFKLICLNRERKELYNRINLRVDKLIEAGLLEEVKHLMSMGLDENSQSMKGIGYKEIIEYLKGEVTFDEAVEKLKQNTRRYAKRQLTWFRRYQDMEWINLTDKKDEEIMECLRKKI